MTNTEQPPEGGPVWLIATLALAGLVCGLLLAGAYRVTLPHIEHNKAEALRRAVFKVLPGTTDMRPLQFRDGAVTPAGKNEATDLFGGFDQQGALTGYAIKASGPGFQDTIEVLYGYDPAKKHITGMEVLSSRETPGLGDKIYKDPEFQKNFLDLSVEPAVELVKDNPTAANQVDAITGATISSNAVVKILNESLQKYRDLPPEVEGPKADSPEVESP